MQIKTTKLQDMITRAMKGVGNNKLIPITELLALEVADNKLTITTTDSTNYVYIKSDIESDDFYAVVNADLFSKLISRMTSEDITLTITANSLEVKGNGTYNMPIPLDEDGTIVKYPNPAKTNPITDKIGTINISLVNSILNTVKPALATKLDQPCFTGYYVGDSIIGTDTFKITAIDHKVFDSPKLISREMMDLLGINTEENIDVYSDNSKMMFVTDNCVIYGSQLPYLDDFPVDAIKGFVTRDFECKCRVAKLDILQLLDRISLFVNAFDNKAISLSFTPNGLQITNKQSSSVETISYIEDVDNFKTFNCMIDIDLFRTQIKSQVADVIDVWYNDPSAIKLVDDKTTSIVALIVD